MGAEGKQLLLYVSPQGDDAWSGRLPRAEGQHGPFATLRRARDEVRRLRQAGELPAGGVVVEFAGGRYELDEPVEFTEADSGSPGAPVVYRARRGQQVRLTGARVLKGFERVTDAATLARLDEAARGHVRQTDLRAQGITDLGEAVAVGSRPEIFFNDRPLTLARWPNEGFASIADVLGIRRTVAHGIEGDLVGRFRYEGDRPSRWTREDDVWLHGYWFWDWADAYQKVEAIDPAERSTRRASTT